MSSSRPDMEKFDGLGDYMLWKEKLLAHLEIGGLSEGLDEEVAVEDGDSTAETGGGATVDGGMPKTKTAEQKVLEEKRKKARSAIILSVGDNVLRKIIKEKTAANMIKVLDKLYIAKSLPNRIYLKQRLYGFKMSEKMNVEENINDFLRLIADLEHVKVTVSEEDQSIIFLMALPKQFDQLKDTLKYAHTSLSLEEIIQAVRSKELELGTSGKSIQQSSEALYVRERGRPEKREWQPEKGKNKSRSKSKGKKTCWTCGKEGHFKRQCSLWKERNRTRDGTFERGEASMVTSTTDTVALNVENNMASNT